MSGTWTNPTVPNLPDFLVFIANNMQIPVSALPANSPWPGYAFNQAMNTVLTVSGVASLDYVLAVYNCGGHILLAITPDQTGQTYFAGQRAAFDMLGVSNGMIAASSDQGTSNTFATPEGFKNLTVRDLDFMRTPWGRWYLGYAQDYGSIVGLT